MQCANLTGENIAVIWFTFKVDRFFVLCIFYSWSQVLTKKMNVFFFCFFFQIKLVFHFLSCIQVVKQNFFFFFRNLYRLMNLFICQVGYCFPCLTGYFTYLLITKPENKDDIIIIIIIIIKIRIIKKNKKNK